MGGGIGRENGRRVRGRAVRAPVMLVPSHTLKGLTHTSLPLHRVHTEWRLPISGVHPSMMEKSARAGEGGGARPPPFSKIAVCDPAERADTLPLIHLYSLPLCVYSVVDRLRLPPPPLCFINCE